MDVRRPIGLLEAGAHPQRQKGRVRRERKEMRPGKRTLGRKIQLFEGLSDERPLMYAVFAAFAESVTRSRSRS